MKVLNTNPVMFQAGAPVGVNAGHVAPEANMAQSRLPMPPVNGIYFGVQSAQPMKALKFGAHMNGYVGPELYIARGSEAEYVAAASKPYTFGNDLRELAVAKAQAQLAGISEHLSAHGEGEGPSKSQMQQLQKVILRNGIVKISGPVTDQMAEMVQDRVNLLVNIMRRTGKVQPINFVINSPGGSILAMNSILDSMDMAKATQIKGKHIPVATYVQGYAASAASVITANGTKGYRSMSKRAEIMIHQPLGGAGGQATDIEIQNRHIQRMKQEINEFFAETTNMTKEELDVVMERDYWMQSAESHEKGFVDEIADQMRNLNLTDSDQEQITGTCEDDGTCDEEGASPSKSE